MPSEEQAKESLYELAKTGALDAVSRRLVAQHPADLAELVRDASSDIRESIFSLIPHDLKPAVLAHLEGSAESEVLEALSDAEISSIVEEMDPDDAADVIADLGEERSEEVLRMMERKESDEVRELLKYDDESAGGIMTPDIMAFPGTMTITEALDQISQSDHDAPIYNIYVLGSEHRLVGVLSLWELVRVPDRTQPLNAVAHTETVSATTDMDQEDVARRMAKYDLTSMPIVDEQGRLVGRVTVDDVVDVIQEEASEDILRLAGSDDSELESTSPIDACKSRLPWLLVTLAITCLGSLVLKKFILDMSEVLALTFFVPVVMAMCGSTGMQSSTLIIRSIALNQTKHLTPLRLLGRELTAGAVMGLVCGGLIGLWAHVVITHTPSHHASIPPAFLAFTTASALVTAMVFAAVFGAFVPLALNRVRIDPAVASGPFVTASNDIIALLIYYGTTVGLLALHHSSSGSSP